MFEDTAACAFGGGANPFRAERLGEGRGAGEAWTFGAGLPKIALTVDFGTHFGKSILSNGSTWSN